jgi:POT family proton-dependent oligopeptide transporter
LFLLFLVEMWERFSYYGMRALLVLYLVKSPTPTPDQSLSGAEFLNPGRGWSKADASVLYGWYTGMAYLLPIIGGFIADKLIGTHRSMVVGGLLIALGHVALAISGFGTMAHSDVGMSVFITGLVLIVIGTGHFKPTVSVMVGQLYPAGDPRRDGAFSIFYMGINLGAFLCAFVCGTLGQKVGWHWGFGSAAVGMLAGLGFYMLGRPAFLKGIGAAPAQVRYNYAPALLFFGVALSCVIGLAFHFGLFAQLRSGMNKILEIPYAGLAITLGGTLAVLLWSLYFISIQAREDRGPTACILIFILFNAFFWIAFEQAGTSLNLFGEELTDRHVMGWEMPATWFQSVNPFLIITLAPVFAILWSSLGRRNMNPSQPVKIALGLLLVGAGYLFMVFGAMGTTPSVKASIMWLLMTYFLHTLGELCISPTGLSFVTRAAPVRYVSFLMGLWFVSSFIANLGGGIIASYVENIEQGKTELFWYRWFKLGGQADFYLLFVITSIGAGLAILILTPVLKQMLRGRG